MTDTIVARNDRDGQGEIIGDYAAHVLRKIIDGQNPDGHLAKLPADLQEIGRAILAVPTTSPTLRAEAFKAKIDSRADRDALFASVFAADPLADLADLQSETPNIYSRFKVIWADQAFEPRAPIEWVIDQLIPVGSVSIFYGEPGAKKTWVLLDAAVCVATGATWLGLETLPAPVLWVDEEMGENWLLDRLEKAMRGHLVGKGTPIATVSLAAFDLRKPDDAHTLQALILQTGARLVVIDALADVMPGGDENAVKDVQPLMLQLRRIATETDSALVLIHHANKQGGYRGSSALKGAVDNLILVSSQNGSPNIDLESEKVRHGTTTKLAAVAHWSDDAGQFYLETSDNRKNTGRTIPKAQRYVLRYLAEHGGRGTVSEIKDNADACAPGTARQAVYTLADGGYIRRLDSGASGEAATYGLADKAAELLEQLGIIAPELLGGDL